MATASRHSNGSCLRAAARLMAAPAGGDDHDLWSIYREPEVLRDLIELLYLPFASSNVTVVVGPESRGFVLGGMLAFRLGVGFVPARKGGRYLPGDLVSTESKPDWDDKRVVFEMQAHSLGPGDRVLIVDDWFTTGNQARAIVQLVRSLGATVVGATVIVDEERDSLEDTGIQVCSLLSWSERVGFFRQSRRACNFLGRTVAGGSLEWV